MHKAIQMSLAASVTATGTASGSAAGQDAAPACVHDTYTGLREPSSSVYYPPPPAAAQQLGSSGASSSTAQQREQEVAGTPVALALGVPRGGLREYRAVSEEARLQEAVRRSMYDV